MNWYFYLFALRNSLKAKLTATAWCALACNAKINRKINWRRALGSLFCVLIKGLLLVIPVNAYFKINIYISDGVVNWEILNHLCSKYTKRDVRSKLCKTKRLQTYILTFYRQKDTSAPKKTERRLTWCVHHRAACRKMQRGPKHT